MSLTKNLEQDTQLLIDLETLVGHLEDKLKPILVNRMSEDSCGDKDSEPKESSQIASMIEIRNRKREIINNRINDLICSIDL